MSVQAIIFDLDGVITNTAEYHFKAWKNLADGLGIPFTIDDNEELKGVSRVQSLDIILSKSDGVYSQDEKKSLMEEKNNEYVGLIGSISKSDILPGVMDNLEQIRSMDILTGLASASKNAAAIINQLGINNMFDYIADANVITNSKPAPDIFLDVSNSLSVDPNRCIGVEDAAAGVQAIKSANMFAVGIGDPEVLNQSDIVFPDMVGFDLEKVIKQLQ